MAFREEKSVVKCASQARNHLQLGLHGVDPIMRPGEKIASAPESVNLESGALHAVTPGLFPGTSLV